MIAWLNLKDLLREEALGDLLLVFRLQQGGQEPTTRRARATFKSSIKTGGKNTISIILRLKEEEGRQITLDMWKKFVEAKGLKLFEDAQYTFIHEFIHFLDHLRVSDPEVLRTGSLSAGTASQADDDKYYNNPLETNAYTQQGFSKIDDLLKKSATRKQVVKVAQEGPHQFHEFALGAFSKKFLKNLEEPNKRKLAKRILQLRDEILSKHGERGQ